MPIRTEVHNLDTMSAHADADELIEWMTSAPRAPGAVYVTHGEPSAADTLRARITHELGWPARVPEHLESVAIA
ncbi:MULTISPECIES: MBL fold metallo-hydrolase RNA specificity domain-containing protein [unclassified Microbacterium]|uniref:MBL fold metallo-hydrolase RNA specificity domain-containing protein n=1 Tax=unclassified Microbacterium TaxID=2609290 RepID=UPI00300FF30D